VFFYLIKFSDVAFVKNSNPLVQVIIKFSITSVEGSKEEILIPVFYRLISVTWLDKCYNNWFCIY